MNEEYKLNVFLCGSLKEKKDGEFIARNLGNYCVDLVGKTDLYELLFLLNGAQLLVSNETGVVHMACALRDDLKTLVLSNGNNFGRFAPYPSIYKKYSVVLPQTYGKKLGTHEGEVLGKPSSLDIDEISFEDLKEILVTMY